jgi:ssDNA-binding Zn-finger/Zn-ribbon topoisomerase 1
VAERRLYPEPVASIVTDLLVEHFGDYVDLEFTARMEEELDEVARGERQWVPLLQAFYPPLRDRVDEVRKTTRRRDFTTEPTDEVCSEGHPMVIRLGRNGRFLACSLYPEHKETRPLPGEEAPPQPGEGEVCPQCGEGTLVAKRGKFGPFVGCSRYPDCTYIKKEGPPPPEPLAFEVTCPKNNDGHLVPRRARRTGNVFWGCSNYPKCDFTTNFEPVGALHDTDDGPVARKAEGGICLKCGADVPLPEGDLVGLRLPGGPPNPEALAKPARGGGRRSGGGTGRGRSTRGSSSRSGSSTRGSRRPARPAGTAPDA